MPSGSDQQVRLYTLLLQGLDHLVSNQCAKAVSEQCQWAGGERLDGAGDGIDNPAQIGRCWFSVSTFAPWQIGGKHVDV